MRSVEIPKYEDEERMITQEEWDYLCVFTSPRAAHDLDRRIFNKERERGGMTHVQEARRRHFDSFPNSISKVK